MTKRSSPTIVQHSLQNGEVQFIINTSASNRATEDSYAIRRAALDYHIPYCTTITGATAVTKALSGCVCQIAQCDAEFGNGLR